MTGAEDVVGEPTIIDATSRALGRATIDEFRPGVLVVHIGNDVGDMPEAVVEALRSPAMISIASVEGVCSGSSFALALTCDVVVAGPRASFSGDDLLNDGIPTAATALHRRGVGLADVIVMAGSGPIGAAEAVQRGLVDAVDDDPRASAERLARRLSGWRRDTAIEVKALLATDDPAARRRMARRVSDARSRLDGPVDQGRHA